MSVWRSLAFYVPHEGPCDSRVAHQVRYEHPTDVDAVTLGQFSLHAARHAGAMTVGVEVSDESISLSRRIIVSDIGRVFAR